LISGWGKQVGRFRENTSVAGSICRWSFIGAMSQPASMWTGESAALAITIASRVRCVACAYLHIYGAVPGALEVKQEKNLKYRIMAVGGEGGGARIFGVLRGSYNCTPLRALNVHQMDQIGESTIH
jgi:hypothetical protein